MGEVARVTTDHDFKIKGEVSNRLPAIRGSLVAHFPFDGVEEGRDMDPIMDYSI